MYPKSSPSWPLFFGEELLQGEAQPEAEVTDRGRVAATVRHAAAPGAEKPAAPTVHAASAR